MIPDLSTLTHLTEKDAYCTLFRKSLWMTAYHLLGYRDLSHNTHDKPIRTLETQGNKLLVLPRGTFKTSIAAVAYPIWRLINNPNLRILLDSELYTNSKNTLREIKSHLESQRFTALFGNWKTQVWNEGELLIAPRTEIKKEASLTCSGIGAQKTGQHYDLIIADDMNSPKNSHTPELCKRVIDHYRFYTSLLDPGAEKVIIGTRYSANDLIGFILETELSLSQDKLNQLC